MRLKSNSGFTFIEVLVAMLIFVMAVVVSVDLIRGSVNATRRTKEITQATWLVQNVMTELETKLETLGVERGCEEKAEAKFPAPYENYRWRTSCYPIKFFLSESAAAVAQAQGEEVDQISTNPVLERLFSIVNTYIGEAVRELHSEVFWTQQGKEQTVTLTTHFVRLDLPLKVSP